MLRLLSRAVVLVRARAVTSASGKYSRLPGSMMAVSDWPPLRHSLAITDRICNRSRWDVCWWAPDEDGPI